MLIRLLRAATAVNAVYRIASTSILLIYLLRRPYGMVTARRYRRSGSRLGIGPRR